MSLGKGPKGSAHPLDIHNYLCYSHSWEKKKTKRHKRSVFKNKGSVSHTNSKIVDGEEMNS